MVGRGSVVEVFFFEKKNQKTFVTCPGWAKGLRRSPTVQSVFASFCSQKEDLL